MKSDNYLRIPLHQDVNIDDKVTRRLPIFKQIHAIGTNTSDDVSTSECSDTEQDNPIMDSSKTNGDKLN